MQKRSHLHHISSLSLIYSHTQSSQQILYTDVCFSHCMAICFHLVVIYLHCGNYRVGGHAGGGNQTRSLTSGGNTVSAISTKHLNYKKQQQQQQKKKKKQEKKKHFLTGFVFPGTVSLLL